MLSLQIQKGKYLFESEVKHCLFLDLTEPTVGLSCLLPWDPLCANCLELCGNIFLLPPFSSLTLLKICVRTKCSCIIAN